MNAQSGLVNAEPAGAAAATQPIPGHTLFDSTSVAIATFLGSPLAGTGLMALNYRRMGKKNSAIAAFVIGLAVTGLAIAFANLIPPYLTTAVAIGLVVGTKNAAKTLQGAAVEEHVRKGGEMASRWAAAGLGLALLAILLGGVVLVQRASGHP